VSAVIELPSVALVGAATLAGSAVPTTVVVSVAAARGSTMRDAFARGTVTVSKPSSATRIVPPTSAASNAKVPSGFVVIAATTVSPSRSCTMAPGSARPV
jgi:hypothetical protein